jgi:hypothetical protein
MFCGPFRALVQNMPVPTLFNETRRHRNHPHRRGRLQHLYRRSRSRAGRNRRPLYELICSKLHLPHSTTHPTGIGRPQLIRKLQVTPRLAPWTHEDVWATLVAIFVEQMQLDPAEVRYAARITTDLRVD